MRSNSYFVIQQLVSREIKRKYSRSKLGIVWSVLNPLLSMAVLSLIFSTMFRKSIENYPIYYLTGLVIWNFFTTATNTAMTALADNQALILQVKLPKSVFPLSRVVTAFVNFLYSLAAYGFMLLVFNIPVRSSMLFFPVIIVFVFMFSLGIGCILSVLYVFFGDIRHLYGVALTLWMYLSALFYPLELLPPAMQSFIWQNPVYNFIAAARDCVLYGRVPAAAVILRMAVWGTAVFAAGIFVFEKSQNKIIQKL